MSTVPLLCGCPLGQTQSPALLTWLASSRLQRRLVAVILFQDKRTRLLCCSGWHRLVSVITDDSLASAVAASATGSILQHAAWSKQQRQNVSAGRWIAGHGPIVA